MEENFSEIVRMPRDMEQPLIADRRLVVPRPEGEPLCITHGLHDKPDGKHDDADHKSRGPVLTLELPLLLLLQDDSRRVEHRDG